MSDAMDLPAQFHDWLCATMDENGFEMPHGLGLNAAGELTVYALHLPIAQAYQMMAATWIEGKHFELIFGFDRFTKPNQGTTLTDVMAGWHFTIEGPRPFIVEYQFEPRQVLPFNWSNPFWNDGLLREITAMIGERGVSAVSSRISL